MAQQKRTRLVSKKMGGFNPWPHSVGYKDPVLLWLWCRPAAAAPVGPLAWEPHMPRVQP